MRDSAAATRANDDIKDIEELRRNHAFNRYWARRVISKLDEARDYLLHACPEEDLLRARMRYSIWKEVSEILVSDEAACRRIIDSEKERD